MFRWISLIRDLIYVALYAFKKWKIHRDAHKSQAEFDAIERDPVPEFKRMFDRKK